LLRKSLAPAVVAGVAGQAVEHGLVDSSGIVDQGAISHRRRRGHSAKRAGFTGRVRSAFQNITAARAAISLMVLIVGVYVYRDLKRDVLIIDPFNVPKAYADMGLTGEVIANHISDEMAGIEKEAIANEKRAGLKSDNVTLPGDLPPAIDVEVPGTKLSLKTLVEIIRDAFGISQKHVRGDVVLVGSGQSSLAITVHVTGLRRPDVVRYYSGPANDPLQIPLLAAELVLRSVNPFALGVYKYLRDDIESVREIGQQMIGDSDPVESAHGHDFIGLVYSQKRRWKNAATEYQRVTELAPGLGFGYTNWGWALLEAGRPREAIEKYNKAIQVDPLSAQAFTAWGFALYREGRPQEGDAKFKEAIHRDPQDPSVYFEWGTALGENQRWPEALSKFKQAAELDPQYWSAYVSWGNALARENMWDLAKEKYEKAMEILPKSATPVIQWGAALYEQEKLADAIDKLRKAVQLDPKSDEAHILWAAALIKQRKPRKAIEECEKALRIDPKSENGYVLWGNALTQLGRHAEAKEKFAIATALASSE
jgi:tetratricopeptide (TPR) repeat protein